MPILRQSNLDRYAIASSSFENLYLAVLTAGNCNDNLKEYVSETKSRMCRLSMAYFKNRKNGT